MFVRLFVDENLDRMVPISKQPKEKIQAIIESCSRQFPEFQERARKRIRTYLKSCRRMKKNGMEMVSLQRPPPTPSPGTTQSWSSGTHTSPGGTHSSWASVREEGGCGRAKGGREGSSPSPWVRYPALAGLVALYPSQAHQWGHQSQLPAQPRPK